MNWRRGLLLAGIHLLIATASFVRDEASFWHWIRSAGLTHQNAGVQLAAFQEEQISGNSCDWGIYDSGPSALANVAATANLPVALATGWHSPCLPQPQRSWITNRMEGVFGGNTRRSEVAAATSLCIAVFVLWSFIGSFPLIHPRRWWLEPAAMITLCTILGAALALIPHLPELTRFTMLIAVIFWLWWFALLLWKVVLHPAWQSTLATFRRLYN